MKTRESGMPEEKMWSSFFDPEFILDALQLDKTVCDAVDFGCGYGTFSLSAARRIHGALYGFDIEEEMIKECERRAAALGLHNVQFHQRDFEADGVGLASNSVDYAMMFNILHAEEPLALLREARRILKPGKLISVIHWNYDPCTPRGPSMRIRPRPLDCLQWLEEADFIVDRGAIDLPPYHYGLIGRKKEN